MRRKIVQHGPATHTISLPADWLRKNKLKKGDEVDLTVFATSLRIHPLSEVYQGKIKLEVTNLSSSIVYRKIFAAYVQGYNEIEIVSKTNNVPYTSKLLDGKKRKKLVNLDEVINNAASCMIGFETLISKEGNFILKEYASDKGIDFKDSTNQIIRHLILAIENFEKMKNLSYDDIINTSIFLEKKINTFSHFSWRLLNKKGLEEKRNTHYLMIGFLERIGNLFFDLVSYADTKEGRDKLFAKEILDCFNIIKKGLNLFMENKMKDIEKSYQEFRNIQIKLQDERSARYFMVAPILDMYAEVFQTWIELKT